MLRTNTSDILVAKKRADRTSPLVPQVYVSELIKIMITVSMSGVVGSSLKPTQNVVHHYFILLIPALHKGNIVSNDRQ